MEGNDPAVTGEKESEMTDASTGAFQFGESDGEWGGSEKGRFKKPVNPHGANAKDLADYRQKVKENLDKAYENRSEKTIDQNFSFYGNGRNRGR